MTLIEQIEAADAGSRELDAEIARVFEPERIWLPVMSYGHGVYANANGSASMCPAYTTSLDAAMTLVPEGWRLAAMAEHDPKDGKSIVHLVRIGKGYGGQVDDRRWSNAATPALALCAAALRARAANNGDDDD